MKKLIILALLLVAKSLCAQVSTQPLKINPNGSTDSVGASSLFWTSTANIGSISSSFILKNAGTGTNTTLVSPTMSGTFSGNFTRSGTTTGGTFASPTISGTMTGDFTRSGTTTGGTISALTLTGTTSGSTLIISGSVALNGNTTLGDASGDTLTINAGTVTAPNASGTSSTSVANIATLDARFLATINSARATIVPVGNMVATSGSGGTVTQSGGSLVVTTGTLNGSYATAQSDYRTAINFTDTGNRGFSFDREFSLVFQSFGSLSSATANTAFRVIIGGTQGGSEAPTTLDPPSYACLGLELVVADTSAFQVRLFMNDGTTLTYGTTTTLTSIALADGPICWIISGDATTLKCRVIGSTGDTENVSTLNYSAINGNIIGKIIFASVNDGASSTAVTGRIGGSFVTYPFDILK